MSFTTSTYLAIFFDGKGMNYYADMQGSTDFVHRFFLHTTPTFGRYFKQHMGCSPGAYRKGIKY